MLNRRLGAVLVCLLTFGLLPLAGCGNSLPPLAPVKGKVIVDGKPYTGGGFVKLTPYTEQAAGPAVPSDGKIDPNGNYEIFTGGKSGAPPGKYKVLEMRRRRAQINARRLLDLID